MNKKKYFIAEDGDQKGPYSFNELKEMGISKTNLIWKEGFEDWTEAGQIEKLQSLLKNTPPKLPKSEGKKKKKDKTLNVNLGLGKPKTIFEIKEKKLAKEKLKNSIATTILYYLKNSFIAIVIWGVFLFIHSHFVNSQDAQNVRDPSVVENYYRISSIFNYIGFFIIVICFFIIFHRPMKQIYDWFKKHSDKEI